MAKNKKLRVPAALALAIAGVGAPLVAVTQLGGCKDTTEPVDASSLPRSDAGTDASVPSDGAPDALADAKPDAATPVDAKPIDAPTPPPDASPPPDAET